MGDRGREVDHDLPDGVGFDGGTDMDTQDDDIIDELLDETEDEREACGRIGDGETFVVVTKERYTTRGQRTKWKVKADTGDDSEQQTFDEAIDADRYFDSLLDEYDGLVEDATS